MMSNSLNRFIAVSAFSFLLLLLVNSGEVFSEETEVAKNGTTTSAENSNSTSTAGKDSPALISLHPPHSPLLRESQLSSLSSSPPPLPPPRYNRRPPPQPRQPSYYSHPHNPHQYHHHHPHDHSHDHHHHHPYPNPHHYDDPYHHHYHHPHHLHSSPSPSFYPRSPPPTPSLLPALDPAQLGDLVSGFGQAFSNFLSQRVRAAPADRQARLLNGEHNILATASQLLPAAANRLLGGLQQLQQQPGFGIQSRSTLSPLRGLAQSPKSSSGNETTSSSSSSSPDDGQPSAAASSDHQTMVSSSEPLSPPSSSPSSPSSPPGAPPINYDEEGRRLREDIIARVGHLQNVLTTAMEVSKERRDILTRRLLEQTNLRLEQAKARMDRILSEPQNAQMVLRALQTVNQGVSGITAFLQGLLQRINVSVNVKMNEPPPPSNFSTELPPDSSNGTITAAASKPE